MSEDKQITMGKLIGLIAVKPTEDCRDEIEIQLQPRTQLLMDPKVNLRFSECDELRRQFKTLVEEKLKSQGLGLLKGRAVYTDGYVAYLVGTLDGKPIPYNRMDAARDSVETAVAEALEALEYREYKREPAKETEPLNAPGLDGEPLALGVHTAREIGRSGSDSLGLDSPI